MSRLDGIFHDGCTAGPLSGWLNATISTCCDLHDAGLDHSTDVWTFAAQNMEFFHCVAAINPLLAIISLIVVASPLGWVIYRHGPKQKDQERH